MHSLLVSRDLAIYFIDEITFGDKRSSSEPLWPVMRDVATIEEAISESGTYSYAKNESDRVSYTHRISEATKNNYNRSPKRNKH